MKSSSNKRPHLPLPPLERAFTLKTQCKNTIKQRQDKVRAYVSKQFRSHHDLWKHIMTYESIHVLYPNYVNTVFITILQNDPISDNTIAMSMPTTFHNASTLLTIPILEESIEQTPNRSNRTWHPSATIHRKPVFLQCNQRYHNVRLQSLFPPKPRSYVIIINPTASYSKCHN